MADQYILPRTAAESARLNEQHQWLNDTFGCLIHPTIQTSKPGLRVADMATGTAIWLLDVAKSLPPDSQLFGFDISDVQFPAATSLPKNVSLHKQSILEAFPAEYESSFDIIAVRLVTFGLKHEDWDKAVKNLITLLKPGGYIQWIDPDHTKLRVFNNKAGASNSATRELFSLMIPVLQQMIYPGPVQLKNLFEKHGLQCVAEEVYASDRDARARLPTSVMGLNMGGSLVLGYLVKNPQHPLTQEKADALMKAARAENEGGDVYSHSELYFVVGRQPEA